MMLDRDPARSAQFAGEAGREVVGMEVVDYDIGAHLEEFLKIGQLIAVVLLTPIIAEISQVGRDERPIPLRERKGPLLLAAEREDRPGRLERQIDRLRNEPPRPPHRHDRAGGHEEDRVVALVRDPPVVHERRVGDRSEEAGELDLVRYERFVRIIGARHDENLEMLHQEMMNRRIGQKRAYVGVPRSDPLGKVPPASFEQDDRRLGRLQEPPFLLIEARVPPDHAYIAEHDGERLGRPLLAFPEPRYRALIGRETGDVVTAQSFHRDDHALLDEPRGLGDRIAPHLIAVRIYEIEPRSAPGARDRFRVKPAVLRVPVLVAAVIIHREIGHRRERPVVGKPLDDGEPRAAVGAVYEWVSIPPVGWIAHLPEAILARSGVYGEEGVRASRFVAREDREDALPEPLYLLDLVFVDPRERRRLALQHHSETGYRIPPPLELDNDAPLGITDVTPHACQPGESIDTRPESDALHPAPHDHANPRGIATGLCAAVGVIWFG